MRKGEDREPRESRIASGWTVEAGPQAIDPVAGVKPVDLDDLPAQVPIVADPGVPTARQQSAGMLVALGLLGGVYLLYTYVWFSWASYYSEVNAAIAESSGSLGSVLQQATFWATPLAPILWFLAALRLNRGKRARTLLIWLLVGVVVLVPLPMFDLRGGA